MADSPLFPRTPFNWHFDVWGRSIEDESFSPDGSVFLGNSGEWGCFIESILVTSFTRPVFLLFTQEIGDSEPKWVATVAPDSLDPVSGFVVMDDFPQPHTPLKLGLRLPPKVSLYLRADSRTEGLGLFWEDTEVGGTTPLTWVDTQSDGGDPKRWEQTSIDFIFARGCVAGRTM